MVAVYVFGAGANCSGRLRDGNIFSPSASPHLKFGSPLEPWIALSQQSFSDGI